MSNFLFLTDEFEPSDKEAQEALANLKSMLG